MKFTIKATNITLTPAISDYLDKKLSKLGKFLNPEDTSVIADVEVGMTKRGQNTGDIFKAEINLHTAGKSFRAVSEAIDLYSAIDEMQEKIIEEVSQYNEKKTHLIRRGGQKIKEMMKGIKFFRR
ncbi:MAG: ribosome-associated translation inhibitor RaiA [Candidatus Paceibacterota bacterium]